MDDKQGLFDADNHYYEPRDAFTRYIEPAYRDQVVRAVTEAGGVERIYVDDRPYPYILALYDGVAKPGAAGDDAAYLDGERRTPLGGCHVRGGAAGVRGPGFPARPHGRPGLQG